MNIRSVAAVWAVAYAVIAANVVAPSFPFPGLGWWRAGWWVGVAAHVAVALDVKLLRPAMLFAVAPLIVRALALAWYVLRVDPMFGGMGLWTKVALYAALAVGVASTYSHAAVIRAVDNPSDRA